jgi:NAD(P)-dependent dehydrogenase (short-subunit alcohol dehydrogenase family)
MTPRSVLLSCKARNDVAAVGRPGTPNDIVPVIAFLCSEQSAWITGANIPVDGGLEAIAIKRAFDF